MCDTFVALRDSTLNGNVIFGKNSDRDPNEAQLLVSIPAEDYPEGSRVKCTYIDIPQIRHTNQIFLSKPFWIWGAEMGANEHGVVIGNEAVFSKESAGKHGLIGMDFLRLALERGNTAETAMQTIIELLEQYGQGGNCAMSHKLYYHNSFLIADRQDAWILETVGRRWIARKVVKYASISNIFTIGEEWDLASPDLVDYAVRRGWCRKGETFNFSRCYSDFVYTHFADGRSRQRCTSGLLRAKDGAFAIQDAFSILRSHGDVADGKWSPDHGLLGAEVCMHAGFGPVRGSQSTGSLVAEIDPQRLGLWSTATSTPCLSPFKPIWLDAGLPDMGPAPTGKYDPKSYWWQHERLQREVIRDYSSRSKKIVAERDQLENGFLGEALKYQNASINEKALLTRKCFESSAQKIQQWYIETTTLPVQTPLHFYHAWAWKSFDQQAGMPA